MRRMPWFRVYDEYFTSPSHADLTGRDLWVGTVIMSLVRSSCDHLGELQPWALLPTGKPISVAGIAHKAREPIANVEKSIAALLDTGTFSRREDGAIGMPAFAEKQRGESTQRSAECRARQAEAAPLPIRLASEPTTEQRRVLSEIEALRQGLTYGHNGAPPPKPLGLPALRLYLKGVTPLLESGMTAAQLLEGAAKVAELVEAGELPKTDWTSTKVFSAWLDGMLVKHAVWVEARERKARAIAGTTTVEDDRPLASPEHIQAGVATFLSKIGAMQ